MHSATMDLIHGIINDAKKIKVRKNILKDQVKQNALPLSDLSNCFHCGKVFMTTEFLVRHILRRHPEGMLLLLKKSLKPENVESNKSSDDMKHCSLLESEFISLINEFKLFLQSKRNENDSKSSKDNINIESQEHACNDSKNNIKENDTTTEILSDEIKNLAERMSELETKSQYLNNNFKEFDNVLKTNVLLKQDMEKYMDINNEKILRVQESQLYELRQTLLKDLQKQFCDNYNELKSQMLEQDHKLKRLDHELGATKKVVDSPDFMKAFEEKYGYLFSSIEHKSRTPKKKSKILVKHITEDKVSDYDKGYKRAARRKGKEVAVIPNISQDKLSFLVTEKLSQFDIAPNTTKMSCAEFDEKLKLINAEKEYLRKRNHNFSKIFNSTNMLADHRVNLKLHNKRSRKVKFSEPLKLNASAVNNLLSNYGKIQSKLHLSETQHLTTVKNQKSPDQKREHCPESEGFISIDVNGSGDCSRSYSTTQNHYCEESTACVKSASTRESKKTESENYSFEGASSSINSVPDFEVSTFNKIQESKETGSIDYSENFHLINSTSSCAKKSLDRESVAVQESLDYILKDLPIKNCEEKGNCDHNSDGSDFDDVSSLSTCED